MGCYDSVTVPCPNCKCIVEFRSKARNCNFELYPIDKVPASIAEDLDGSQECCRDCKTIVTLSLPKQASTLAREVT